MIPALARTLLPLLAAALLPATAWAHALRLTATAADGRIHGHLFYSDETPAAGEWVELQTREGTTVQRVRSDATGRFVFAGVDAGDWRLVAEGEEGHRVESALAVAAATAPAAAPPELAALREELRALREEVQRYEQRVRLGEVLGGLGLIAGLAGVAAWWRAQAARRDGREGA